MLQRSLADVCNQRRKIRLVQMLMNEIVQLLHDISLRPIAH